jgi:spore photoproduct lyase
MENEEQTTRRARNLLDIQTIYHEPDIEEYAPDAHRIEVKSYWLIPELHGNAGAVKDWIANKRGVLVLGTKKGLQIPSYERSSDFIAPSHANGCALACAYCYVPRRKGFANPITVFVNIEQIIGALEKHASKQGAKLEPTQADANVWTYELGTNSDVSVDALISDNIRDLVALFRRLPYAKATFATKYVNREMLTYDPQGKTRLRFSLMPAHIARLVDVRTSPVAERLAAFNDFVEAGYEVHVNFAPVIYYDGWLNDYEILFEQLDASLSETAKAQVVAEVAFLTHNAALHEVNLQWHPKAESLLWQPDIQETKISGTGGRNLRYKSGFKRGLVNAFTDLLRRKLPYCSVRYAF